MDREIERRTTKIRRARRRAKKGVSDEEDFTPWAAVAAKSARPFFV
jgi:hypothetical protein